MGRNSKWVDAQPDDAVVEVARAAIENRLERVWHYLELAAGSRDGETEDVHQLRVFSRRAAAALEIFQDWLPKRRAHWMRRRIKHVRQAAGAARDFDVLLERWTNAAEPPASHVASLLRQIQDHRDEAQQPIVAVYEKLSARQFRRKAQKLAERVKDRAGEGACGQRFGCMARVSLRALLVPYLQAAHAELADAEALHSFRIQGKQIRYAMEMFAGAFDDSFRRQLYPLVVSLQDRLGAINDHASAQTYFVQWHARAESAAALESLEAAIQREHQQFEDCRQQFLDWWTTERRDEFCQHFERLLVDEQGDQATPAPAV